MLLGTLAANLLGNMSAEKPILSCLIVWSNKIHQGDNYQDLFK